ncbi:MAG: hypothetical protein ACRDHZ_13970 [Ktedonobacteraceae bacterium]
MHTPKKSLCDVAGHNWHTTTANNYRTCQYSGCRAAQRSINGQWVDVTQRVRSQDHAYSPHQLGMFDVGITNHG